jgi:hypothetical protein
VTALLLAAALVAAPAPRVGANVDVAQPTRGPVVVVLADVVVSSEVVGDVVAVGGDVELAPGALVRGDVVALGGSTFGVGRVTGRIVSLGALGPARGDRLVRTGGRAAWGVALLRVGVWVTLGTLLLLGVPGSVRGAGEQAARQLWQTPLAGVLALLVWFVVVVLALLVTATPLGAACLLLAVALLLIAKVIGIAGVAWALGRVAVPLLPLAWRGELPRTGVALLVLAGFSTVPVLGAAVWLVVNVMGVGAVVGVLVQRRALVPVLARLGAR